MFDTFKNWLFYRALRVSHATTVKIATKLNVAPEVISAYNDAGAGLVVAKAAEAAKQ